jgi:hypothetical protein
VEENIYTKFLFNIGLALLVFFWAGVAGVLTATLHMLLSLIVLVIDVAKPEKPKAQHSAQPTVY